jgi:hypothetical protein
VWLFEPAACHANPLLHYAKASATLPPGGSNANVLFSRRGLPGLQPEGGRQPNAFPGLHRSRKRRHNLIRGGGGVQAMVFAAVFGKID